MMRAILSGTMLALGLAAPVRSDDLQPTDGNRILANTPITDDLRPITDLDQIARTGVVRLGRAERLGTNDEETGRGIGALIYADVAPSVVLVQSPYGHGTGFFIRSDGWLLTNRHVVRDADYHTDVGGQVLQINIGRLDDDGWMRVVDEPVRALVYKTDPRRDLALARLLDLPANMSEVPHLALAESVPRPGSDCVAIGHPAAGTLWTLRTGQLAGFGEFPRDQMTQIIQLLNISSVRDRNTFEESMRVDPAHKQVFLSTCGLNPGDSGGPLVNEAREVIAVSFAIPKIDVSAGVDLGSFSFHIHLNEVRGFLEDWPMTPVIDAPNHLPAADHLQLEDADKDGTYETMLLADRPGQPPRGLLFDLDGDSYGGRSIKELESATGVNLFQGFEFEYCLSVFPRLRISYDTDNDGSIDLIFSDENHDGTPDTEFTLVEGDWSFRELKGPPANPMLFDDEELQKRLTELRMINAGQ